jgi:hypothetical protein
METEGTKMSVVDLPIGMVISYDWACTKTITITKVTHHKKMGTVQVDGIQTANGEPITMRYLDKVEFGI